MPLCDLQCFGGSHSTAAGAQKLGYNVETGATGGGRVGKGLRLKKLLNRESRWRFLTQPVVFFWWLGQIQNMK